MRTAGIEPVRRGQEDELKRAFVNAPPFLIGIGQRSGMRVFLHPAVERIGTALDRYAQRTCPAVGQILQ